jgi:serine/threonine protein kinase/CRP-like cAMP-binding protein
MANPQAKGQSGSASRKTTFEPMLFGRHCLIDRISQGGMSDIYLAKSVGAGGFQKPLVVKKLLPRYSSKPRYVKRFINEAKTLARLNHTNIVQILDMGIINGEYFLALEYIEGRNVAYILSKAMRNSRPPSLEFALHVVLEVAKGLAYSHRRKGPSGEHLMLVHQDINSFNVMVSFEAEVKIIDFGIARMFLENDDMDGLPVAGKLLYFSPEQLQRRPVDRRVDIYGTGVLLYEILTGQRLIQHQETVKATVKTILEMDIRQKVESDDLIRKDLRPILIRAMALDPEDRYPWMEDMIDDLRAVIKASSLDLNTATFSKYMKEQFRREILLDKQRLRNLYAVDVPQSYWIQGRYGPAKGLACWNDVDLVAEVLDQVAEDGVKDSSRNGEEDLLPRTLCVQAGEPIFSQGEPASDVYVIQKGKVRTFIDVGRRRQTLSHLREGDVLGESALLDDSCHTESAEAEEDCQLFCLDREAFARIVGPDRAGKIVVNIVEKLRNVKSLVESSLFEDALSRLIHGLIFCYHRSGEQNGRTIQYDELTDLLGLKDDDATKRYLRKLESLEILRVDDKTVQVTNLSKLENVLALLSGRGKLQLNL